MRLSETEKGIHYKLRAVADLRIQYQCEYRLCLKQKLGDKHTEASITGTDLHRRMALQTDEHISQISKDRLVPVLIIIATLIVGFLWIFW